MTDAIVMRGVNKSFGPKRAVIDLDLTLPRGALYGFIGPNGAGKTTTIRMIMSILFPDSGALSVLGRPSAVESKDLIGYLPEERGVYKKMRVGAFLRHMGRLKGIPARGLDARIAAWLERMDLADCLRKRCEELSKGMQQKVQFISAVLHEPELIILDEPFSGLDPVNTRLLRDLIREQNEAGRTVIFSTHVMPQAEQICEHIVMINKGRKVLDASVPDIRARFDPHTVLVEPLDGPEGADSLLRVPGVRSVSRADGAVEVSLEPGHDPHAAIRAIVEAVPVSRIELRRPTLEDVFIEIVQGQDSSDDEAALRAELRGETEAVAAAEESR